VAEALPAVETFVQTRAEEKGVLPFRPPGVKNGSKNRSKTHPKPTGGL
jgi:hypothetical protein